MESITSATAAPANDLGSLARDAWLLVTEPANGITNMAVDEALLARAQRTGEVVWRVYGWAAPTISLGRHQTARDRYDLERARARRIEFVRRPTGGRAILHHREITYSVSGPTARTGSLRESYRAINRLLCEALRLLGVEAREAEPRGPVPSPGVMPCFESPVAGELVVNERKLVGSAQVRDGSAFLQHGSILVDDDQYLLQELLHEPEVMVPPATLRSILGRPITLGNFATVLETALSRASGVRPARFALDEMLSRDVRALARSRYAAADWTWRR